MDNYRRRPIDRCTRNHRGRRIPVIKPVFIHRGRSTPSIHDPAGPEPGIRVGVIPQWRRLRLAILAATVLWAGSCVGQELPAPPQKLMEHSTDSFITFDRVVPVHLPQAGSAHPPH
jgi:hypothetical protein